MAPLEKSTGHRMRLKRTCDVDGVAAARGGITNTGADAFRSTFSVTEPSTQSIESSQTMSADDDEVAVQDTCLGENFVVNRRCFLHDHIDVKLGRVRCARIVRGRAPGRAEAHRA